MADQDPYFTVDSRFRVLARGKEIELYGSLTDTTPLQPMDDLVVTGCIADFSHLTYASWIGMNNLCNKLRSRQIKIHIKRMPYHIFRVVKLIDGFAEIFSGIDTLELMSYDRKNGHVGFQDCDYSKLQESAKTSEFIDLGSNRILLPWRFVEPMSYARTEVPFDLKTGLSEEYQGIATDILRYGLFAQCNTELCCVTMRAGQINMADLLGQIGEKIEAAERSLQIVDPKSKYTLVDRIGTTMKIAAEGFHDMIDSLEEMTPSLRSTLASLSQGVTFNGTEVDTLKSQMAEYVRNVAALETVAKKCEINGQKVGSSLNQLRSIYIIRSNLLTANNLTNEQIRAIREEFAIMDVLSEDDWQITREILQAEVNQLDDMIGKCVVTIQIFDLLQQILSHRVREARMILDRLPDVHSPEDWEDMLNTVARLIGEHLVTDQEKATFSYYMPKAHKQYGMVERKEPGDLLLF